jgi:hypothetical protein
LGGRISLKLFVEFVDCGRPSSRGQNLGSAKPAHFAQGHAHVRPLVEMTAAAGIDMPSVPESRLVQLIKMPLMPTEGLTHSIETAWLPK